jgi:hypothetical protein
VVQVRSCPGRRVKLRTAAISKPVSFFMLK